MQTILGKKIGQTQKFLMDGKRVFVTQVQTLDNPVVMVKSLDRDGYIAVQLGYGTKKHATKAQTGHSKKGSNLNYAPILLHEVRFTSDTKLEDLPKPGDKISVNTVLEPGDMVNVVGKSKGKGFAGVVKRYHFRGGPKTHGQSDRHRAPGAISSGTTPGRVYKGKRMAGKMGNDTVTVKNLQVIKVLSDGVLIGGAVPGVRGAHIVITKVGKNKKFTGIYKEVSQNVLEEGKKLEIQTEVN